MSPRGDDRWSGLLPERDAEGMDFTLLPGSRAFREVPASRPGPFRKMVLRRQTGGTQ